ncbi:MAG: tyrosine-protein kinase family protein [Chloroflexi bacterium]|nr:tyrosine-protein kinase family protein [Chloroflexota bacterium]
MATRTILFVGQTSPAFNALPNRYKADIVHKYPTVQELMKIGRQTLLEGSYNTLLIGPVEPSRRNQIIKAVTTKRSKRPLIGVITNDSPTYDDDWVAIPPNGDTDTIASALQCSPRRGDPLIVLVVSTKGGVGKSSVAVNTAVALGQLGHQVAVLEDDLTSRSVQPLLGIPDGPYTSANLVAEILSKDGYISPEVVQQYLVDAFGIKALIGPPSLLTEFPLTPDMAKDILAVISRELDIDVVVIDAPPDFIHSSSFTFGLLKGAEDRRPPLVLVPVAPEKLLLKSVDDTIAAIDYLKHPIDRIWPVVNCTRPTHDPESLRNGDALRQFSRPPVGVISYCPEAQYVGDTGTPLVAENNGRFLRHIWRTKVLGVADIPEIKSAYARLAKEISPLIEK